MEDEVIENLWIGMTDIPFDDDEDDNTGMAIAEKYHIWSAGTGRYEIWTWFNENHSKGVTYLLYDCRHCKQVAEVKVN